MALFGPRDRNLPLLTQLYQVEEDNIPEMDAMLTLRRGSQPFGMEKAKQQAQPVMELHKLARRMMDQAIDGKVQMGDLWVFNILWEQNIRQFGVRTRNELSREVDGRFHTFATDVRDLADIVMTRDNCNDPWRDWETEIVHDLAGVLLNQGKDLGCCPECKSVFVTSRRGRRYCSSRCQNRAGVRRMADRKKSSRRGVLR